MASFLKHCEEQPALIRVVKGSVLPIVALIAVGLIAFVGVAIDSTLAASSKSQQHHVAEYAALVALRTFGISSGATNVDRLLDARDRAQEIAGVNITLADPFLKIAGLPKELGPTVVQSTAASNTLISDGPDGRIAPGIWHFFPPASCTGQARPCPCDSGGNWAGQCFEELLPDDLVDPLDPRVNAFRAELRLRANSPLKTFFARVVGQSEVRYQSIATAAIVPAHGVFLLDLSRSAVMETHHPYEYFGWDNYPAPVEYAFKFQDGAGTGCNSVSDHTNPCLPACYPGCTPGNVCGATHTSCQFEGGVLPNLYTELYNYDCLPRHVLPPERPQLAPGVPPDTKQHYKDDYQCFTVDYQDAGNPLETEQYLIDAELSPQPLESMLEGVNYGLNLIENRQVPGDLVGALGFDHSAHVDVRKFPLSPPGRASFDTLKRVSDIPGETPGTVEERFQNHFLFPRVDSVANMPQALREALIMLRSAPNSQTSENFVVMMSDGLTFCTEDGQCGRDEASYDASYNEVAQIVLNEYVPENVKFHFLMFGEIGLPHMLLYKSNIDPTTCMAEEEIRTTEPPLPSVDYSNPPNLLLDALQQLSLPSAGRTIYFYKPNAFHQLVRETNGIWGPIRPCYEMSPGSGCINSGAQINNSCARASAGVRVVDSTYTDGDGRMPGDPLGRPKVVQAKDYIDEILRRNPYVLVE